MAKLMKASEEISNMVVEISNELGLAQMGVDFEVLNTAKAKEVVTITKANKVAEILTNRDDLIVVIVYEAAFDRVDEKTRYMWLRMAMDTISFDNEKDKIILTAPTITVPVGFYEKYKNVAVDNALLAKYTISQIEDEEKQRKAEAAAQKKAKKKKN
jgi:hypothetical protein